jgi:hypothetical protein
MRRRQPDQAAAELLEVPAQISAGWGIGFNARSGRPGRQPTTIDPPTEAD